MFTRNQKENRNSKEIILGITGINEKQYQYEHYDKVTEDIYHVTVNIRL